MRNGTFCKWGLRPLEKPDGPWEAGPEQVPGPGRTLTHQAAPSKSICHTMGQQQELLWAQTGETPNTVL